MNILVTYYSRTGNTQKLAESVAGGVGKVEGITCTLKPIQDVTMEEFGSAEGVIAGSPVYFGTMAAELKQAMDAFVEVRGQMEGKVGAAFATSHDPSGGKETTILSILQAFLIYGMVVVGDPLSATGHYGTSCIGSPDEVTRTNAALLGERVARLTLKLRS